ncbi:MAG TPA: hypothetical protein PKE16_03980 [Hyphomicrobium sp.]|nr:hypothetical protein [Desulfovibrio sp.]HML27992.1 hypothetical protein [Hyphomicrobium sp.]
MGRRFYSRITDEAEASKFADIDDAAAVYPDHDIVTRHFAGPLTIGDFVTAFAEGSEGHGGLPTYLRITLQGDASKLRKLMTEPRRGWTSTRTSH